jgi:hypothetical protein
LPGSPEFLISSQHRRKCHSSKQNDGRIAFTGSKVVGDMISDESNKLSLGYCRVGGKNPVVVTANANLDNVAEIIQEHWISVKNVVPLLVHMFTKMLSKILPNG